MEHTAVGADRGGSEGLGDLEVTCKNKRRGGERKSPVEYPCLCSSDETHFSWLLL